MPFSEAQADISNPRLQRRLTWALRGQDQTLQKALSCDESARASLLRAGQEANLVAALGHVIMHEADPTPNKRFTPWLVREYAAGRLILEDLGTANETLTLFQRYASRLKPEERDIQRYGSLAAAWQAVREFAERDEAHSNRAQKAVDRAKAYAESRILRQDPDGFTVAVPLTEFAATWWGKGTRWCTAAEKNNQFWQYHQQAPLIVITIPRVGKFQLWAGPNFCHFRDASDRRVPDEIIREQWFYLRSLFVGYLKENGGVLQIFSQKLQNREFARLAVAQNGLVLAQVCYSLRSQDICRTAVAQNGKALEFVPSHNLNKEICRIAVSQNGNALGSVPEKLRTAKMCRIAVIQDAKALKFVPEHLRGKQLCRLAVVNLGRMLQYVPWSYRTHSLCLTAVKHGRRVRARQGLILDFVPLDLRDEEICRLAVTQDGAELRYVPEHLRSASLCSIAVAQDGEALAYVPRALRTEELCYTAVAQNSWALRHVPASVADNLRRRGALPPCQSAITKEAPTPRQTVSWASSLLDRLEQALGARALPQEEKNMAVTPPDLTCNWHFSWRDLR